MSSIVAWFRYTALALGAPGLFLIAFLDSSFLSLPEINDILLVWMVTRHKERFVLYAMSSTLGSLAGCLVLYYVGGRGGGGLGKRRFGGTSVEHAMSVFRRYGVMAVLIPSILPPPAPFKIFVFLAGIAGIGTTRFTIAIAIGRGLRYFAEGFLALRYGDQAIDFIRAHGTTVAIALVGVLGAGLAAYIVWTKARAGKGR